MNKSVDNFELIKKFCNFEEGTFYTFFCITRKKDEENNKIIKRWYIDSIKQLEEEIPYMRKMADTFNARIYMNTDKRSISKYFYELSKTILDNMYYRNSLNSKSIEKITASITSMNEITVSDSKYILMDIDIDDKITDSSKMIEDVYDAIYKTYTAYNSIETLPEFASSVKMFNTIHGHHIVFPRKMKLYSDELVELLKKYNSNIEIKENASVLVYYN